MKYTFHKHVDGSIHKHLKDQNGKVVDHTCIANVNEGLDKSSRTFWGNVIIQALNELFKKKGQT